MSIELSDYLADTLAEAKRLLEIKSDLGRIPLSKKQLCFREKMDGLIDEWFRSEPARMMADQRPHSLEDDEVISDLAQNSQYNSPGLEMRSSGIIATDNFEDDSVPF